MGLLRGAVGFFTFFAAFVLKSQRRAGVDVRPRADDERGRHRDRDRARAVPAAPDPRGVDPGRRARGSEHPAGVRGALVRACGAHRRGGGDRGGVGDAVVSRSTASCNATAPTRRGAGRSRASRRASNWCGCSAGCSRSSSRAAAGAGIFLVALVLLFAGLSYVGAVRRPGPSAPPTRNPTDRGRSARVERADAARGPTDHRRRAADHARGRPARLRQRRRARRIGPTAGCAPSSTARSARSSAATMVGCTPRVHVRADDARRHAACRSPACRRSRCSRRTAGGACSPR